MQTRVLRLADLANSLNPAILKLKFNQWLIAVPSSSIELLQDVEGRGLIIGFMNYRKMPLETLPEVISVQYTRLISDASSEEDKEKAVKKLFQKILFPHLLPQEVDDKYQKLKEFYQQKILNLGIYFLIEGTQNNTFNATGKSYSVYERDGHLYVAALLSGIEIIPDLEKPSSKIKIPGFLMTQCRLTEQGFKLEYIFSSNHLLREICMGKNVVLSPESLQEARAEELAQGSEKLENNLTTLHSLVYEIEEEEKIKAEEKVAQLKHICEQYKERLMVLIYQEIPDLDNLISIDGNSSRRNIYKNKYDKFLQTSSRFENITIAAQKLQEGVLGAVSSSANLSTQNRNKYGEFLEKSSQASGANLSSRAKDLLSQYWAIIKIEEPLNSEMTDLAKLHEARNAYQQNIDRLEKNQEAPLVKLGEAILNFFSYFGLAQARNEGKKVSYNIARLFGGMSNREETKPAQNPKKPTLS